MDLNIKYNKLADKKTAYEGVKAAITPELIAKFQVKAEIIYGTDKMTAKGKGFTLDFIFNDDSLDIKLDLSFLLKPLRSKIVEAVEKQVNRVI